MTGRLLKKSYLQKNDGATAIEKNRKVNTRPDRG